MSLTCKNCGGKLIYDSTRQNIYCDSCGKAFEFSERDIDSSEISDADGVSKNELRLYRQAVKLIKIAETKNDWCIALDTLSLINNVFNSEELRQICLEKIEICKSKEQYEYALKLAESDDVYSLRQAATLFQNNTQWECDGKVREINERIEELSKKEEAELKEKQRIERAKKKIRTVWVVAITAVIAFAGIYFLNYKRQQYNVKSISVSVNAMKSEYHPDESPYINGCYYIYFDYKIKNGTKTEIDYLSITTEIIDKNGKQVYKIFSEFGGYGNSALGLSDGEEGIYETYIKENQPQNNQSFNNVFGSELSDYTFKISIDTVKFSDGHYYNK